MVVGRTGEPMLNKAKLSPMMAQGNGWRKDSGRWGTHAGKGFSQLAMG